MANTSMQARSTKFGQDAVAIQSGSHHRLCKSQDTFSSCEKFICAGFCTIIVDVACAFTCSVVSCCLIAVLLRHRLYCWRAFKPSWLAIRSWPTVCSCLPRCKPKLSSKPSHSQAMCVRCHRVATQGVQCLHVHNGVQAIL